MKNNERIKLANALIEYMEDESNSYARFKKDHEIRDESKINFIGQIIKYWLDNNEENIVLNIQRIVNREGEVMFGDRIFVIAEETLNYDDNWDNLTINIYQGDESVFFDEMKSSVKESASDEYCKKITAKFIEVLREIKSR